MTRAMNDLQMRQFLRAENQYLNEPREPEVEEPRCACCGRTANNHTELFQYHDEPWCYDCLEHENLNSDDIDELPVYDEGLI